MQLSVNIIEIPQYSAISLVWRLNVLMYGIISGGTRIGEPDNVQNMRENFVHYIDLVKKLLPAERMRATRLEDGLG